MRIVKWLLGLLVALVGILVIVVATVPLWFDPNDHKDRLVGAVEDATGREFALEGRIEMEFFPWLAFAAGPLRLGNDPAFGGEAFLKAERVSAELRLLPLLRRQVEVGTVRLVGPELRLEVNQQGRGNWESLVEAVEAGQAPPAEEPSEEPVGISVEAVVLEGGMIDYQDRSSGTAANLSAVDLTVEPLRPDVPLAATLEAAYSLDELRGRLSARLQVSNVLSSEPVKATLNDLSLSSETAPAWALTIAQAAELDLGSGRLALPRFEIESHNATGIGSLTGSEVLTNPILEGRLKLAEFDLRRWLQTTGLYTEDTSDPAALKRFALDVDWRMKDELLAISQLSAELDDSRLTGTASFGDMVRFELAMDRLDADRYLPPESADQTPEQPPEGEPELALGRMAGSLTIGELVLAGLTASNVEVALEADAEGLRILPIQGDLYGGTANADLRLDTSGNAGFTAAATVRGVRGGELLGSWVSPPPLTGVGDLSADLRIGEPFAADPLASLNGTVSLSFTDGALYGLNVMRVLRQVLAATGRGKPGDLFATDQDTDFSSFRLVAGIEDGLLRSREFSLQAPYLDVTGEGTVNLVTGALDYTLTPTLVQTPEARGGDAYESLEGTPIPLQVGGSMADPKVSFDVTQIVFAAQGDRLKRKLTEKLGGSEDDAAEAEGERNSEDILKSLFQDALNDDNKGEQEDGDDGSM